MAARTTTIPPFLARSCWPIKVIGDCAHRLPTPFAARALSAVFERRGKSDPLCQAQIDAWPKKRSRYRARHDGALTAKLRRSACA
jgi:hypothetical protein